MKRLLNDIDQLISDLKKKGDSDRFTFEDSKAIICLEIIRLEISEFGKLSDRSLGAICSIAGWSHHYYLGVHDKIHQQILYVQTQLDKLNSNEFKADIKYPAGNNKDDWFRYFGGAIRYLLEEK